MKVLIVTSRFPLPPWRGNQVRTVEWLRALEGAERWVVCPRPAAVGELGPLCDGVETYRVRPGAGLLSSAVALSAGLPAQEGLYRSRAARQAVRRAVARLRPDVVVVQMVRCGWAVELVRECAPSSAVLFDAIDAMGRHFERAGRQARPPLRQIFRAESRRCRCRELALARSAEITTAVSARELDAIEVPATRGRVVPVAGREVARSSHGSVRPTVVLTGNLGYRPTVAAALWFARQVWPRLLARVPEARWLLVGARPAAAIRRLARLPGVEVHRDVPDLAPYLAPAWVAVAPMASGSGVPMKVLEAWSAAVPVVADPWAAAALEADGGGLAVASTAEQWLETLVGLLTDRDGARRLGEAGHRLWQARHRFDRVAAAVRESLAAALALRAGDRAGRSDRP